MASTEVYRSANEDSRSCAPSTDQLEPMLNPVVMGTLLRKYISIRSPEPLLLSDLEDTFRDALENTHAQLCVRIMEDPDSYTMTRNEFAIFDYFDNHFMTDEVAENARKRYNNSGGTTKPALEYAVDYVQNVEDRLQTQPGAFNTFLDIMKDLKSQEFVPLHSSY